MMCYYKLSNMVLQEQEDKIKSRKFSFMAVGQFCVSGTKILDRNKLKEEWLIWAQGCRLGKSAVGMPPTQKWI